MLYDPKEYYPGGWKTDEKGKRKKQIYSWEAISAEEIEQLDLVAIKAGPENGFFVIDLDDTTDEAAAFIERTGLANTGTRKVRTQGGGYHWYFEIPPGVVIRREIRFLPGLDLLGEGMVFCPPSEGYELREGPNIEPAPAALISEITSHIRDQPAPVQGGNGTLFEGQGRRNQSLYLQGVSIYRKNPGIEQRDLESILRRENEERFSPALDIIEVAQIAGSIIKNVDPAPGPEPVGELVMSQSQTAAIRLPKISQVCGPLCDSGVTMIAGQAGVGKSLFALHMAGHIAAGEDFEGWSVPAEKRVLFVDGEMATQYLQERLVSVPRSDNLYFIHLWSMAQANLWLNLGDKGHQDWFLERYLDQFDMFVFDTVSALNLSDRTVNVNDGEYWLRMEPFHQQMRARNKTVVWTDNLNKKGEVYGTSAKHHKVDSMWSFEEWGMKPQGIRTGFKIFDKKMRGQREEADGCWYIGSDLTWHQN